MHSAGSRSKVRAEGGQLSDKDIGISARIFDRLVDRAAERCKAVAQSGQKVLRLLRDDVRLGQADDAAEIGAAIRMAILLLTVEGMKTDGADGTVVSVWVDENGAGYSIRDAQGELVDSGNDWSGLVHRLESALPEGEEDLAVIWP